MVIKIKKKVSSGKMGNHTKGSEIQGGLGIIDLQVQNKRLLSKWIIKLLN